MQFLKLVFSKIHQRNKRKSVKISADMKVDYLKIFNIMYTKTEKKNLLRICWKLIQNKTFPMKLLLRSIVILCYCMNTSFKLFPTNAQKLSKEYLCKRFRQIVHSAIGSSITPPKPYPEKVGAQNL